MPTNSFSKRTIGGEKTVKTIRVPVAQYVREERSLYGHTSYSMPQAYRSRDTRIDPGKISMNGAVFHDIRHAHIKKVLHDDIFWQSLDAETRLGPGWDVHVLGLISTGGRPDFEKMKDEIENSLREYGINRDFDQMPFFVFYSPNELRSIIPHFCVSLSDRSPTEAFDSLREVLRTATTAIKQVERQNYSNSLEILNLVQNEFTNKKFRMFLIKAPSYFETLKSAMFG